MEEIYMENDGYSNKTGQRKNKYGSGIDKEMFGEETFSEEKKHYGLIKERKSSRRLIFLLAILITIVSIAIVYTVFHSQWSEYRDAGSFELEGDGDEDVNELFSKAKGVIEGMAPDGDEVSGTEGEAYGDSESPAQNLLDSLSMETYVMKDQLFILCTNNGDRMADVELSAVFYDADDTMMSIEEGYLNYLNPGQTNVLTVYCPRDTEFNPVSFDHYELSYVVEESSADPGERKYYGDQFTITSNVGVDGTILCDIENPTGLVFENVWFYCIFYNEGQPVWYYQNMVDELSERALIDLDLARDDETYQPVPFDDYRIIVGNTFRSDL